ncbi:ribonuclease domain-containing protein [Nocardia transvalensis]|uniref:ribonuclease domain-containing protein n=1 Tax=Nocardia transvalensis TaxID=37333 RepID=UPI001E2C327A|nr:ribonuclease domain-containing protein [Nocardia transvalensis]
MGNTSKALCTKPITVAASLVLAAFAALALLFAPAAGLGGGTEAVGNAVQVRLVADSVPARAWETLRLIDAGEWPPADAPGTHGGETWQNREGLLPATDGNGRPIHYREWDVNRKKPGQSRDAERIVTGSDGSAWYTGDHYRSFTRMR